MGQMLSIDDASKVMGVHPRTVLRMIERGELEASKVGRVWRIAPTAINALTGQPVVSNGSHGAGVDGGLAQRLAAGVLSEALPVFQAYCRRTGKTIADLSVNDIQGMV